MSILQHNRCVLTLAALLAVASATACGSSGSTGSQLPTTSSTRSTNAPSVSTPSVGTPPSVAVTSPGDATPPPGGPTSASAGDLSNVVGNGKQYTFSAGTVPTSKWPNACDLLPAGSAAAALGGAATGKQMNFKCQYSTASSDGLRMTIDIEYIGSDAAQQYAEAMKTNVAYKPVSVPNIGLKANLRKNGGASGPTVDVLTKQAQFRVSVQGPLLNGPSGAELNKVAAAVAKAVAGEFAS